MERDRQIASGQALENLNLGVDKHRSVSAYPNHLFPTVISDEVFDRGDSGSKGNSKRDRDRWEMILCLRTGRSV